MKHAVPAVAAALALAAVFALAPRAAATTYVLMTDEAMVDSAAAVVEARILSVDSAPGGGMPSTDYMIEVDRVLSGDVSGRDLIVRVPGGERPDGFGLLLEGMPRFAVGERVLLFLNTRHDGTYGIYQFLLGAFHETVVDGKAVVVRNFGAATELAPAGEPAGSRERYKGLRDAHAFATWIGDRARGRQREPDYFAAAPAGAGLSSVTDEYKLFVAQGSGLNIRWFEFDDGQQVGFRIQKGGQPGFGETATANAAKTAIAAWNNAVGTDIHYRYDGTTTSTRGFDGCPQHDTNPDVVCVDGINSIIFADADGSIDDPFNCSSGGTLAVGGPVYGDSAKPPRIGPGGKFYEVTVEAEVITNKGIECYLDSQRLLEQLLAHELGHTLGMTHPCEGDGCGNALEQDALMYPFLHNDDRGAQLNADDLAGIRALYPGATGPTGSKPAAPSDLVATALSATSIGLAWVDHASNEATFRIERKLGSGSFVEIASVGANVTSFNATGLSPTTEYTFRVRARNSKGNSAYSNQATATTVPAKPAAPADLVAVPESSTAVGLTWTDRSSNETSFRIEQRSPVSGAWSPVALAPAGSEQLTIDGLATDEPYSFRVFAVNSAGDSAPSNEASASTSPLVGDSCTPSDTVLCLLDRFRVSVDWQNQHALPEVVDHGVGHARPFADSGPQKTGTFWFFAEANTELIVKMLDGSSSNDRFWVFHGQLTEVEFWISVLDTGTGNSKTYHNPPDDRCGEFDTDALPATPVNTDLEAVAAIAAVPAAANLTGDQSGSCVADDDTLCLFDGRFAVEVEWTDQHHGGQMGPGHAVDDPDSGQSGFFWFFDPANVELVVKVLDGRVFNQSFWVFYGSLSDVEYRITVTDTLTSATHTYFNAPGNQCGQFDTDAFPQDPSTF